MATKKHGGKRAGSGRKPVADKKEPVFLYVKKSVIKKAGGRDTLKKRLEADLECGKLI